MNAIRPSVVALACLFVASGCKSSDQPGAPAPVKSASVAAPVQPAVLPLGGGAHKPEGVELSSDPDDIGAPAYKVCDGQGANPKQLSPAFLEHMDACHDADVAPVDHLAEMGGDGSIIEGKGDCQYAKGISCHFHTSMEFVHSGHLKDDEHAVGEMHCIVPSANANSPTVYGAHLRCKAGTSPEHGTHACSKELLAVLDRHDCHTDWKCCDNGTLTKPVGKQAGGELKLRPDFRICEDDFIEIDCGLLHEMHGHTANVAGVGEEYTGHFNPPAEGDHH